MYIPYEVLDCIHLYLPGWATLARLSELDIWRIYLEEYHEPVLCTFNRFIRYTVIFSEHTWNTEDSEREIETVTKTWLHFLLYLDVVLV